MGGGGGGQVSIKKGIELGIEEWQLDLLTALRRDERRARRGGRAGRREEGREGVGVAEVSSTYVLIKPS